MSQTPIALQTTLAHKVGSWHRLLISFMLVLLLSGGLWWAKETQLLDTVLNSTSVASTTFEPTTTNSSATTASIAERSVTATSAATVTKPVVTNNSATVIKTASSTTPAAAIDTSPAASTALPRSLVAVAGIDGLQLWNADGQLLHALDTGTKLRVTARTADGQWLTVTADETSGWALATQVVAFDLSDLPVTALTAPTPTTTTPTTTTPTTTTPTTTTPTTTTPSAATDTTPTTTTGNTILAETTQPVTNTVTATPLVGTTASPLTAIATTSGANLNVRSGPGTDYAVADKIANGATVTVLGRNENSSWVQIQRTNAPADPGWVAAQYLQVSSPLDTLPVVTILTD